MPRTAEFLESHLTERGILLALSKMTGSPPAKLKRIGPRQAAIQLERPPVRRKAEKARRGLKAYRKGHIERKPMKKAAEPERPLRGRVNKALHKIICGDTSQKLFKANMSQSVILSTIGTHIAREIGGDPALVTALVGTGLLVFMSVGRDLYCG